MFTHDSATSPRPSLWLAKREWRRAEVSTECSQTLPFSWMISVGAQIIIYNLTRSTSVEEPKYILYVSRFKNSGGMCPGKKTPGGDSVRVRSILFLENASHLIVVNERVGVL